MAAPREHLALFARQFALALRRATGAPHHEPAAANADADLLRASARHLPGAGWLLGLLAAFVFVVLALLLRGNPFGPAVAAVGAVLAVVLLTRGVQERAVFRTANAGPPHVAPGADHGPATIALVLLLAGRIALLAALGSVSEAGVVTALFAAPVVSRFAPLMAGHWLGKGSEADRTALQVGAAWCVPPLLLMLLAEGAAFALFALLAAALAWVAILRWFRNRPGPFDADRGASLQQACELAFYLGASLTA